MILELISPMDTHERHVVPLKSFRNLSNRQDSIHVNMKVHEHNNDNDNT